MLLGDGAPNQRVGVVQLAERALHAIGQTEAVGGVRCRRQMPRHLQRVAGLDLHLARPGPLRQDLAVHGSLQAVDAVDLAEGQVAEDKGERPALEAEVHRFGDDQRGVRLNCQIDIEAVGRIALGVTTARAKQPGDDAERQ